MSPSRFYLPNGGTTPTILPLQDLPGTGTDRSDMATTRQNTALATKSFTLSGFYDTVLQTKTAWQFVGPSMSAQTIAGTFSLVLKCADVDLNDNGGAATNPATTYVSIRVFTSANLLRGYLYVGTFTFTATADANGQGWPTTLATIATRIVTAEPLTSLAVSDGDRLVVSIGRSVGRYNGHTSSNVFGDPSATADHTLSAGQTMVGVPWIEFSQDLFGAAGPVTLAASGTVAAVTTCSGNPTVVSTAQTLPATGTIAVLAASTGNATRVPLVLPATGTAAVVSTTTGDPTRTPLVLAATGTMPVVSASTGDATRTPLTLAATGTTAVTSSTTGDATRVPLTLPVSGTTPAVTTTTGNPAVVGGPGAASGTITAVTTTTGNPTRVPLVLAVSGTVDVIATTLGDTTRQWVTLAASGTIPIVTFTSGAANVTGTQAPTVRHPVLVLNLPTPGLVLNLPTPRNELD